jgi:subtilisin-like proprotein convertase family protein
MKKITLISIFLLMSGLFGLVNGQNRTSKLQSAGKAPIGVTQKANLGNNFASRAVCDGVLPNYTNSLVTLDGAASQIFPDFGNATLQSADDFTMGAQDASICQVDITGVFFGGGTTLNDPSISIQMTIYSDAAGVPGSVLFTENFPGSVAGSNNPSFSLSPTGAPELTAGTTYWLSVQAVMSFTAFGQWGWISTTDGNGSHFMFQDPGNLIGGCPTWATTCVATSGSDLAMNISFNAAAPSGPISVCGTGNPQPIPVTGTGGAPCVGGPTTSPANVSATGNIGVGAGDYTLDSVELNLTHTWDADLDITLVSPSGTSLNLSSDNGGSGDNYTNTVFMDGAPSITTGTAPFTGTFQAQGGTFAATFAGEPINGNWTLSICDDSGGDGGNLLSYCINFSEITTVGNPPSIVCPGDIVINNTAGTCGGVANYVAIALDDEDGNISSSIVSTHPSGSTFPVGDTLVTLSVTDSDGNTATCDFTVTVIDNEAPVAVCQDLTLDLDPVTGTVTITGADVDNGSTDNCGIASMTLDISTFDCSMTGANTVVMTVTDNSGNSSTCTSTVTVQDVTAPEVFCVGGFGNFSESEDFEGASIPAGWSTVIESGVADWTFGSNVMPLGPNFATNAAIFDDDAAGSGQVNLVRLLSPVYDLTGASNVQLSFEYAIQDFIGSGTLEAEVWDGAAWQQVLFIDDMDVEPVNTGDIDVSAFANAAFQVRYTYDDEGDWAWGAGVDNFLLTYEATSGGGLDVFLDANGMASVDPNDLVTGVNEACGYTITAGGAGGGTMETLTTTFAGGNGLDGAMFDVMAINDLTIDSFDVNLPTGADNDFEVYYKTGTWVGFNTDPSAWTLVATLTGIVSAGAGLPTSLDLDLGIVVPAGDRVAFYVTTTDNGTLSYTNGTTTGNLFASDANLEFYEGRGMDYPFTGGFEPRVFNGNILYTTGGGGGGLDFTCADLGENLVEVTVTDASGNTSTCTAVVNVFDITAPVITCGPEPTVSETASDSPGLAIPDNDPAGVSSTISITDDVTIDDLNIDLDITHTWVGDINVTITSPMGTSVMIVDRIGGTGGGVGCSGDDILATLDDAAALPIEGQCGSGVPSIDGTFSPNNPLAAFNGESTLGDWTITISDNAGGDTGTLNAWGITYSYANTNTDVVIELGPDGTATIDPYDIINSVDEACGIATAAVDVPEVSCADIGTTILVTVFVTDASGNLASCSANVTVVDLLAPEITCPADQTVDPGAGNLFYIVPDYFATGEATAIDNCTDPVTITTQDPAPGTALSDGVYTITMTATDEYGNTSTCNFELTIESILGVNQNSLENGVALYPNPAANVVNLVNRTNISLEKMMIYDINGKLVNQTDLRNMQAEKAVDVSSLAAGVYVVQIIGDNASTVKRLIKE